MTLDTARAALVELLTTAGVAADDLAALRARLEDAGRPGRSASMREASIAAVLDDVGRLWGERRAGTVPPAAVALVLAAGREATARVGRPAEVGPWAPGRDLVIRRILSALIEFLARRAAPAAPRPRPRPDDGPEDDREGGRSAGPRRPLPLGEGARVLEVVA